VWIRGNKDVEVRWEFFDRLFRKERGEVKRMIGERFGEKGGSSRGGYIRKFDKSTPHTELCDLLNECDDIATKATIRYLEIHNLPYLKDRVIYEYSPDFGIIRPLREVWVKLLDFDPLDFVEFYEEIYRFRKVPRYENIFLAVLISIVSGLAANELHERYKIWRGKNKTNKKMHDKFSNSGDILFEYLTKVYAIREAHFLGKISYERFNKIRDFLKRKIIIEEIKELDINIEKDFTDLWNEFVQNHSLLPLNLSIEELKNMIKLEYASQTPAPRYQIKGDKKGLLSAGGIILHATSVYPGSVCGMIKNINSVEDLDKILSGDIGVFKYSTPDMIPGMKRCVGAIGLPGCGGLTGHLAIICHELGIPCVVGCDYDKFNDGQVVYLDSSKHPGEIHIILSIEEIKKLLQ